MKILVCFYFDYGIFKGEVIKIFLDVIFFYLKLIFFIFKVSIGEKYYEVIMKLLSNFFGQQEKICYF